MKTTNLFLNKTDDIYSTEITTRQTTKIIENTRIFNNLEKFLDNSYYCCCEYGMKTTNQFLNKTDGIYSTEITTRQTTIQTTKIIENTRIFNNLEKLLDTLYSCCCEYERIKTTNLFLNKTDGIYSTEITTRHTTMQTTKIIKNTGVFNNLEKLLDNSYFCCCEYVMKTTNLFLNKTDGIYSTEITTRQTTMQTTKIIKNTGIFNNLEKLLDTLYSCCCEYERIKTTNLFLNKTDVIFSTEITSRQTTKISENTEIFDNLEKFLDNSYHCCCEYGMKTINLFLNKTDGIYSTKITTRQTTMQTTKIIKNTTIFDKLGKLLDTLYSCCCEYETIKTTNLFSNKTDVLYSTEINYRNTTETSENTEIFDNLEKFLDNSYYCCCEYEIIKTTNLFLNKTDSIFSTEINSRQTTKTIENTEIFNNLEKFLDNSYSCCCEYGMKTTNLFLNMTDGLFSIEITTRQTTKIIENTGRFNNLEIFLDNSYYCCCEYGMKTTNLFLNKTDSIYSTEITTRHTTRRTTKIIENTRIFNNLEKFLDNLYSCCCEYEIIKTTNLFLNKTDGIFSTEITTRHTTKKTAKIIENTRIFNNLENFLDNSYSCCCEYGMKTTNQFLNKTDSIYSTEITTRQTTRQTTKINENTGIFNNLEFFLDNSYTCCCEHEIFKTTNLFSNKTDVKFSTEITHRQTNDDIVDKAILENIEKFLYSSYYCCFKCQKTKTTTVFNSSNVIYTNESINKQENIRKCFQVIEYTRILNNIEKLFDSSYKLCCFNREDTIDNTLFNLTNTLYLLKMPTKQYTKFTDIEYLDKFLFSYNYCCLNTVKIKTILKNTTINNTITDTTINEYIEFTTTNNYTNLNYTNVRLITSNTSTYFMNSIPINNFSMAIIKDTTNKYIFNLTSSINKYFVFSYDDKKYPTDYQIILHSMEYIIGNVSSCCCRRKSTSVQTSIDRNQYFTITDKPKVDNRANYSFIIETLGRLSHSVYNCCCEVDLRQPSLTSLQPNATYTIYNTEEYTVTDKPIVDINANYSFILYTLDRLSHSVYNCCCEVDLRQPSLTSLQPNATYTIYNTEEYTVTDKPIVDINANYSFILDTLTRLSHSVYNCCCEVELRQPSLTSLQPNATYTIYNTEEYTVTDKHIVDINANYSFILDTLNRLSHSVYNCCCEVNLRQPSLTSLQPNATYTIYNTEEYTVTDKPIVDINANYSFILDTLDRLSHSVYNCCCEFDLREPSLTSLQPNATYTIYNTEEYTVTDKPTVDINANYSFILDTLNRLSHSVYNCCCEVNLRQPSLTSLQPNATYTIYNTEEYTVTDKPIVDINANYSFILDTLDRLSHSVYNCCCEFDLRQPSLTSLQPNATYTIYNTEEYTVTDKPTVDINANYSFILDTLNRLSHSVYNCCCEVELRQPSLTSLQPNATYTIYNTEEYTVTDKPTVDINANYSFIIDTLNRLSHSVYNCCCEVDLRQPSLTSLQPNATYTIYNTEEYTVTDKPTVDINSNYSFILDTLNRLSHSVYNCCCEVELRQPSLTSLQPNATYTIYNTEEYTVTDKPTVDINANYSFILDTLNRLSHSVYNCCCEVDLRQPSLTSLQPNATYTIYNTEEYTVTDKPTVDINANYSFILETLDRLSHSVYNCCCEVELRQPSLTSLQPNATYTIYNTEEYTVTDKPTVDINANYSFILDTLNRLSHSVYNCCCEVELRQPSLTSLQPNATYTIYNTEEYTVTDKPTVDINANYSFILDTLDRLSHSVYNCCCKVELRQPSLTSLQPNATYTIYNTEEYTVTDKPIDDINANYSFILDTLNRLSHSVYNCCCEVELRQPSLTSLQPNATYTIYNTEEYTVTDKPIDDINANYSFILDTLNRLSHSVYNCCCKNNIDKTNPSFSHYTESIASTLDDSTHLNSVQLSSNYSEPFESTNSYSTNFISIQTSTNLYVTIQTNWTSILQTLEYVSDSIYTCCCKNKIISTVTEISRFVNFTLFEYNSTIKYIKENSSYAEQSTIEAYSNTSLSSQKITSYMKFNSTDVHYSLYGDNLTILDITGVSNHTGIINSTIIIDDNNSVKMKLNEFSSFTLLDNQTLSNYSTNINNISFMEIITKESTYPVTQTGMNLSTNFIENVSNSEITIEEADSTTILVNQTVNKSSMHTVGNIPVTQLTTEEISSITPLFDQTGINLSSNLFGNISDIELTKKEMTSSTSIDDTTGMHVSTDIVGNISVGEITTKEMTSPTSIDDTTGLNSSTTIVAKDSVGEITTQEMTSPTSIDDTTGMNSSTTIVAKDSVGEITTQEMTSSTSIDDTTGINVSTHIVGNISVGEITTQEMTSSTSIDHTTGISVSTHIVGNISVGEITTQEMTSPTSIDDTTGMNSSTTIVAKDSVGEITTQEMTSPTSIDATTGMNSSTTIVAKDSVGEITTQEMTSSTSIDDTTGINVSTHIVGNISVGEITTQEMTSSTSIDDTTGINVSTHIVGNISVGEITTQEMTSSTSIDHTTGISVSTHIVGNISVGEITTQEMTSSTSIDDTTGMHVSTHIVGNISVGEITTQEMTSPTSIDDITGMNSSITIVAKYSVGEITTQEMTSPTSIDDTTGMNSSTTIVAKDSVGEITTQEMTSPTSIDHTTGMHVSTHIVGNISVGEITTQEMTSPTSIDDTTGMNSSTTIVAKDSVGEITTQEMTSPTSIDHTTGMHVSTHIVGNISVGEITTQEMTSPTSIDHTTGINVSTHIIGNISIGEITTQEMTSYASIDDTTGINVSTHIVGNISVGEITTQEMTSPTSIDHTTGINVSTHIIGNISIGEITTQEMTSSASIDDTTGINVSTHIVGNISVGEITTQEMTSSTSIDHTTGISVSTHIVGNISVGEITTQEMTSPTSIDDTTGMNSSTTIVAKDSVGEITTQEMTSSTSIDHTTGISVSTHIIGNISVGEITTKEIRSSTSIDHNTGINTSTNIIDSSSVGKITTEIVSPSNIISDVNSSTSSIDNTSFIEITKKAETSPTSIYGTAGITFSREIITKEMTSPRYIDDTTVINSSTNIIDNVSVVKTMTSTSPTLLTDTTVINSSTNIIDNVLVTEISTQAVTSSNDLTNINLLNSSSNREFTTGFASTLSTFGSSVSSPNSINISTIDLSSQHLSTKNTPIIC